MRLKKFLQSYNTDLLNKDELNKLSELNSQSFEYDRLLKRKNKLNQELKDINLKIKSINKLHSEFASHLKKTNKDITPIISVGFDKRWSTYNCIVKISGSSKSFYLGKEKAIKKKLQQFHSANIMGRGIGFVKAEIIRIVNTVIMQFIDINSGKDVFKKRAKLNLDNVLERYVASGEWDYWVSR